MRKIRISEKLYGYIFQCQKLTQKWNFDIFCPRNFRKIAKLNSKFKSVWAKNIKISLFGSVFDTEKYGRNGNFSEIRTFRIF